MFKATTRKANLFKPQLEILESRDLLTAGFSTTDMVNITPVAQGLVQVSNPLDFAAFRTGQNWFNGEISSYQDSGHTPFQQLVLDSLVASAAGVALAGMAVAWDAYITSAPGSPALAIPVGYLLASGTEALAGIETAAVTDFSKTLKDMLGQPKPPPPPTGVTNFGDYPTGRFTDVENQGHNGGLTAQNVVANGTTLSGQLKITQYEVIVNNSVVGTADGTGVINGSLNTSTGTATGTFRGSDKTPTF